MNDQAEPWHKLSFYGLLALLLFAPLFRAGNRPLPLLLIELMALGLLLLLLWDPKRLARLPGIWVALGLALLALPLLYLLPLPGGLTQWLPGREIYTSVLASVGAAGDWRALSIIPAETEYALLATLPVLAVFASVYLLPVSQVKTLVYVLIGLAAAQAALGLMQYGAGPESVLHFGNPYASNSASGTYANRDHLAGMLAMVLPVVLGLLSATLGQGGRSRRRRGRWRRGVAFLSGIKGHQAALFAALAVLLLLGLVFTRSRAGVALAMLGLFLSLLAFARRLGGSNVYGTLGTVMAVALVAAVEIGLAPVLDRFSADPLQDARWVMYASTLDGIGSLFPFGGGAGVFPSVYPIFQPTELGHGFVNHAHNDYLQALFEQGLFALIVILLGGFIYLRQWPRLWIKSRWGSFRFIQVGAGIGLSMMLAHSLVDFNLQIPANAIIFAFLAAVFFKDYREPTRQSSREERKPRPQAPSPALPAAQDANRDEEQNPFLR